jgi:hypothetical protein
LKPLDECGGRVGVPCRQAGEERIVGNSPHRDYAPGSHSD